MKWHRSTKVYILLLGCIALILPLFGVDPYLLHVLTTLWFYITFSSAYNLLMYSGQTSLGQAAMLGVSCYASTLLLKGGYLWLAVPAGILASGALGLIFGLVAFKLKAWFLALVTLGFSHVIAAIILEFREITGGVFGVIPPFFLSPVQCYYIFFIVAVLSLFFVHRIILTSKIGLAFAAIRENEEEAKNTGINTNRYKILAFVIAGFLIGPIGVVYAQFLRFIDTTLFTLEYNIWPAIMTILGGLYTIEGPIIGSSVFLFFWEGTRVLDPKIRTIMIGVIFIIVTVSVPGGLSQVLRGLLKRLLRRAG